MLIAKNLYAFSDANFFASLIVAKKCSSTIWRFFVIHIALYFSSIFPHPLNEKEIAVAPHNLAVAVRAQSFNCAISGIVPHFFALRKISHFCILLRLSPLNCSTIISYFFRIVIIFLKKFFTPLQMFHSRK